jgi:hypothetical protein
MMEVRHRGFQLAQFLLLSANVVPEIRTTPRGAEGSGRVANLSLREVGTIAIYEGRSARWSQLIPFEVERLA